MQTIRTIIVDANQTIYDLALQYYGTLEAVGEIFANNPLLVNDKAALIALGIDPVCDKQFYFDVAVEAGFVLKINTDSKQIKSNIVREINTPITTYNL